MKTQATLTTLAQYFADQFSPKPQVIAIGQGGSVTSGATDSASDIDLYVFISAPIALIERQKIMNQRGASRADLDLNFWDPGDEWFDAPTGIEIDIMYWDPCWIEDQIDRVLVDHQASMGYSTCHWHTIKNMAILHDPQNWLSALQHKCARPYPAKLRENIVAKNYPILGTVIPAYSHQIKKAISRNDLISVQHRTAALLASYFDIIFAVNSIPHPGEKRLLQKVAALCATKPAKMNSQIEKLLTAPETSQQIAALDQLLAGLDQWLGNEGFGAWIQSFGGAEK